MVRVVWGETWTLPLHLEGDQCRAGFCDRVGVEAGGASWKEG